MGGFISIAIDGPAAAGKSSLAKNIAKKLGFVYLRTGWLYRAVGLYAYENGVNGSDAGALGALIDSGEIKVELLYPDGEQRVYLNGRDVSELVGSEKIGKYASDVGNIKKVRDFLLEAQREAARRGDVIMEGRDVGTVILPGADVKIFLTATAEDRAMRRCADEGRAYGQILDEIKARDEQDAGREIAPLLPAEDAVILDNTGLQEAETLSRALNIIKERLPNVDIC